MIYLPKSKKNKHPRPRLIHKGHAAVKNSRYVLAAIALLAVLLVLTLAGKNTAQVSSATTQPANSIQATPVHFSIPANNKPGNSSRLNITYNILNDEDYANHGYWAIGNYTKHINATFIGKGTYLAEITLSGSWRTVKGAKSPNAGVPEPANGSGTFNSIYYVLVPGRLNNSNMLSGFIGTFNLNGSIGRILNQTQPRYSFNWTSAYFGTANEYINLVSENTIFVYQNQTLIQDYNYSRNNGTVVSYGDIIT